MTESIAFIPYKAIKKEKSREYYQANKETIGEKNKIRYSKLSPEQKKMRQEYNKRCYDKLSPERKEELKQKQGECNCNKYHNSMVAVSK